MLSKLSNLPQQDGKYEFVKNLFVVQLLVYNEIIN